MSDANHGSPCWYELSTTDPTAAGAFYAPVLGWTMGKAPMEGFEYHLATVDGAMVAGMAAVPERGAPEWLIYFAVEDCDATATAAAADGGTQISPPADIPGTGRFAILADAQGARFGILQPLPGGQGGAFDQTKRGHGNWHELTTSDAAAAMAFYARHLGWTESSVMDMGPMGKYRLIGCNGTDIGGMMDTPPGRPSAPAWLPYFGADRVADAQAAIVASGGQVTNGPHQVPGGAMIVQARDPQGAAFAVSAPA